MIVKLKVDPIQATSEWEEVIYDVEKELIRQQALEGNPVVWAR